MTHADLSYWSSSVNYALRIMEPVLNGNAAAAEVKQEAEDAYAHEVQSALQNRVWNAGCSSVRSNFQVTHSSTYQGLLGI